MTQPLDPKRWKDGADEAPPQFHDALAAEEACGPDAAALRRMLGGIALEVGQPELQSALEPRLAAQPMAASGLGSVIKLGVALLGLAIGAGAYFASRSEPSALPSQPVAAVSSARNDALPSGDIPLVTATPPALPAPTPSSVSSPPPRARRAAEERPADPSAELAVLERAQRTLASDARRALALADQHRRDYPRGTFVQEREMLAIDALLRLGQRDAAERRGRAFLRSFPTSSHRTRLADLLRSAP